MHKISRRIVAQDDRESLFFNLGFGALWLHTEHSSDTLGNGVKRLSGKISTRLALLLTAFVSLHAGAANLTTPQPPETLTCAAKPLELTEAERISLETFYQNVEQVTQWNNERLQQLTTQLEQLADDGLNPERYQLSALKQLSKEPESECREWLASYAYLTALQHLQFGATRTKARDPFWRADSVEAPADQLDITQAAQNVSNLTTAFEQARPQSAQYQGLRRLYAKVRHQPLPHWSNIPDGPMLRPGHDDARIPALTRRLIAEGYLPANTPIKATDTLYAQPLLGAVREFQKRHHVQADGVLGQSTLNELNVSPQMRRDQLRANLERWRWLSKELEPSMLLVDVAGAELFLYDNGQEKWRTRVQVGRSERPTPLLKSRLSYLTVNPTWSVPPTIFKQDKLPAIQQNPEYLAQNRFSVLDMQGKALDPATINWQNPGAVLLRQEAGTHNPLGKMAIRFSNPFSVYLHDTPSQALFEKLPRVFSSGCVRVENVSRLTAILLENSSDARKAEVATLQSSGKTRNVSLPGELPILIAYWTASTNAQGEATFRPDLYQYDKRVIDALEAVR